MSNTFTTKVSGRVSSRGWAIALGLGAIVLATILLIVYLDRYRARVSGSNAPTQVLVAKRTIPAGTPGTVVTEQLMYGDTTLPKRDVLEGAIADPRFLEGRAAAVQILPGQQITAADFAASASTTVDSQITGPQRALSITIDAVHGSLAQLKSGDNVDVYINHTPPGATGTQVELFRPNIKLLSVPGPEGGALVLRVPVRDAADWAFAADHARFWFVLRPPTGASRTPEDVVRAADLTKPR
jgi:Flp pilus assembly protein CpaB